MTSETRFLQIFGYKILSSNFVQNDGGKTKKKNVKRERLLSHALTFFLVCGGLFFWQSQNFIFDQLIGRVKGFDHLVGFRI
mgnify:CR=1 FL=1